MLFVVVIGCAGATATTAQPPEPDASPDAATPSTHESTVEPTPSQSTRANPKDDPYAFSYRVAHEVCGSDVEQLYEEAGTRDPQNAAEWYGEGLKEGQFRDGGVAGCLDAVMGTESRH